MSLKKSNTPLPIEPANEEEPKDTYWFIYYFFSLLGLVHILPWTFFITANEYWMFKFRNTSISAGDDRNYKSDLQRDFSPFITVSLQISTITFYILCLFFGHNFKLKLKLFGTLTVVLSCFLVATAFIFIDTDGWQTGFFAITMLTVATINSLNSIYGLSLMEIIPKFPKSYLGSYLAGVGLATTSTAFLELFALSIGISTKATALVYFWTATGVIAAIVFVLMLVFTRNKFFKFHLNKQLDVKKREILSLDRIVYLFKKIWTAGAIMFFWQITIASVHPGITTLIVPEGAGTNEWSDKYFLVVTAFVMFAVLDYIGRIAALKIKIQVKPLNLVISTVVRMFILIPLLMLRNAQPRHNLPVVFNHDYQYIIIMAVFALSGGYLSCMVQFIIPQLVPIEELEDALQLNTVIASLILGVLSFLPFVTVNII